jgi:hypothetical protein
MLEHQEGVLRGGGGVGVGWGGTGESSTGESSTGESSTGESSTSRYINLICLPATTLHASTKQLTH